MATQTILSDDLDGSTKGNVQTLYFTYGGVNYEIDLSDDNAGKFHDAINPFVEKARRSGGSGRKVKINGSDVRAWAKAQGLDVNDRGAVPKHIIDMYKKASGLD